jgi:response regulator RpfG family c-di-GMP phosphodiesterase
LSITRGRAEAGMSGQLMAMRLSCQTPRSLLLVEDEDLIWTMMSDFLEDKGFDVVKARNGDEAVQLPRGPSCLVHAQAL